MKTNVGAADRFIRISLGVFLFYQALMNGHLWGYVGIIPLLTGAIGWCPIFKVLGISTTCKAALCTSASDCQSSGEN